MLAVPEDAPYHAEKIRGLSAEEGARGPRPGPLTVYASAADNLCLSLHLHYA